MKYSFIFLLFITNVCLGQSSLWSLGNTIAGAPTTAITIGATSIVTGFNCNAGTASTPPQPLTYAFTNLSGANGAISIPTPWEGSIDAGIHYFTSFSSLNTSSGTLLLRVAATATAGTYGVSPVLNVTFSATGASPKQCALQATVSSVLNNFATIITDHTKVPNTDQTNFTYKINGTYALLKNVANGGTVTDINNMVFSTNSAGTSLMKWEIEFWNPVTGQFVANVLIPTLSHITDNTFYLVYGALGYVAFQGGAAGSAWDANTVMVQHFSDGTTLSLTDASGNANNGTNNNVAANTGGEVDGAGSFTGSTPSYVTWGNKLGLTGDLSIEMWFKTAALGNPQVVFQKGNSQVAPIGYQIEGDGKISLYMGDGAGNFQGVTSTTGITAGTWAYTVATRSGVNVNHYLNGNTNGASTSFGPTISNSTDGAFLGMRGNGTFSYTGLVDEFVLSSAQRSGDWIKTKYNDIINPSTAYTITF